MADWDAEDFDPEAGLNAAAAGDKWEGEDEDDDVKDSWDVESDDEDKNKNEDGDDSEKKALQVKKKKPLAQRIKEKEEQKRKEMEERRAREEAEKEEMTPEEQAAERLRQQKLVEDADFELAKEAFGIKEEEMGKVTIDSIKPSSREDFDELCKMLTEKLTQYEKSPHYVPFLENLYRDTCLGLEADDVKRLGSTISVLGNEKAKAGKAKGKTKKKKGAVIKSTSKRDALEDYSQYGDEYEDFM
ncbi:eukaryotic translation initiation factor 3 subunit J-like isoform X2 [Glandiceps talaboti]